MSASPAQPALLTGGKPARNLFKKDFPAHTSLCYSAAKQQLGATAPRHHERSHQHEEHDELSQQLVVA